MGGRSESKPSRWRARNRMQRRRKSRDFPTNLSVVPLPRRLPGSVAYTPSPDRALTPRVSLQSAASLRRQGETDQATDDDDQDPAGNWYPSREPCCGGVFSSVHFCTPRPFMNSKITMFIPGTAITTASVHEKFELI